jgi:uncharacterized phage infection (PIP) family protein YhgE
MIHKVQSWLKNPSRNYAEGLAIFKEFASPEIKKRYLEFFSLKSADEKVKQFDTRATILLKQVVSIHQKMKLNPEQYKNISALTAPSAPNYRDEILKMSKKIKDLERQKLMLDSEVEELADDSDDKQSEIDDLQDQLTEKDSEISELQTELEDKLKQFGLKIVTYDKLPKDIQAKFDRTKEIVPLIAKIHAEISDKSLSDSERKKLADELCSLDDERRKLWDEIDAWTEGKDCILEETKEMSYSDIPLVKGMQIAKRIERLEENIKRTQQAIEKHIKARKKNLQIKAEDRLAAYQKELVELKEISI